MSSPKSLNKLCHMNFVNLQRLTTDRTPRIDERKELRVIERMKREDLVTRFAEILLRNIARMSIFAEIRRIMVWTLDISSLGKE